MTIIFMLESILKKRFVKVIVASINSFWHLAKPY